MIIDTIIDSLENDEQISVDKSFEYAKSCSILLRREVEKGRKILIYALDNWDKLPSETKAIWTDLIEYAGFYPYLEKEKARLEFNNIAGEIRKELHCAENISSSSVINEKKYFHEEQIFIKKYLDDGNNLIVSAPTSFGKSLIIEEMVATKKYHNIVIIQPTLALLDETRKKLKKYGEYYKIIVKTSQEVSKEKGNLFLLTAERVMEYQNLPHIDFFVLDEFYKLSARRDDERSDILNSAFYKLLQQNPAPQFYLLGPNIDGVSEGFEEKYKCKFIKTNYSLIENKTIDVYNSEEVILKQKISALPKKEFRKELLFDKLYDLKDEQSIIYCSSPDSVRRLAHNFCIYLEMKKIDKGEELPLRDWIIKNIHPNWYLIDSLSFGIGQNDGTIPKHINSAIIDYFNDKKLRYLFCTTTLIEGVNTNAKNVFFFDKKKGRQNLIDYFDYANIKGRSGRMMVHYIGRTFNFSPAPLKEADIIVDIPFFHQNPINDEVLNGLTEIDIKCDVKKTAQYKELMAIPKVEREMFQKNGVLVSGQKQILEFISKLDDYINIETPKGITTSKRIYDLLYWTNIPNYDQLGFLIKLCWDNLIKVSETTKPMSSRKLTVLTRMYIRDKGDLSPLIRSTFEYKRKHDKIKADIDLWNDAIKDTFWTYRHWFQYKVPKWLRVMNELQSYICKKNGKIPGNYSYFASLIENDFIQDNLTILSEYGIPKSAIDKLLPLIDKSDTEDEVMKKIKVFSNSNTNLMQYEIDRINRIF